MFAGGVGERGHGACRLGERFGLQPMRFVESLAQARLPAGFKHWLNLLARDVRDEELHGIGADINDGAPRGCHETIRTAGDSSPKLKGGYDSSTGCSQARARQPR
jgi:hypothetical protein